MENLTAREIIGLVDACGRRVCTSSQHHGCPYGDESCLDCVERLQEDYDRTIEELLRKAEDYDELRRKLREVQPPPDWARHILGRFERRE